MKLTNSLNDESIQKELGRRLERLRLERGLTQDSLAERAGIGKRTLERLESGESVQLTNFIRVLRELDQLENLDGFIPEQGPRPMDLVRLQGKNRQRAYSPRSSNQAADSAMDAETKTPPTWKWGDEK